MKRIALIILGCSLAILALAQHPVQLSFERNGKAERDFGLLAYYEIDSVPVLVRLTINQGHILLPHASLPDSNVYFLVQVKRRYYPFYIDRTTIQQRMRWEFQWLSGRQHRHWAAEEEEKRPDLHAASILTYHPLDYGHGRCMLVRYRSSRKTIQAAKRLVIGFLQPEK